MVRPLHEPDGATITIVAGSFLYLPRIEDWTTLYPTPSPRNSTDIMEKKFPVLHKSPQEQPYGHIFRK